MWSAWPPPGGSVAVERASQVSGHAERIARTFEQEIALRRAIAGEALADKFEPIVARTTAQSQAASAYRALTSRAKPMLSFVPGMDLNLDDYVTRQALDGLFAVIGEQERAIRENPAERGTALLKKVFSATSS